LALLSLRDPRPMTLYSIMGGCDLERYHEHFGNVRPQLGSPALAYNYPPTLPEVHQEYGDRVYQGLQALRRENMQFRRGSTSWEYSNENAMEGMVFIPQGQYGQTTFSYSNTHLPVTPEAAGRWYPALLVESSWYDLFIFECPKIALARSRLWLAHRSRVRLWVVLPPPSPPGTEPRNRGHSQPSDWEQVPPPPPPGTPPWNRPHSRPSTPEREDSNSDPDNEWIWV